MSTDVRPTTNFRLYKSEKLCSVTAIDALFASRDKSRGALAFPLRAVWRENPGRTRGADIQFIIIVPKRRLRHAVDRVTMRRRIREAYRLNRSILTGLNTGPVDLALIYVAPGKSAYAAVETAVRRLLGTMSSKLTAAHDANHQPNP